MSTATAPRPEIQALRALAVAMVVAFHFWPSVAPGGFVGVDVFFAISGFLITSLLLREIDRTGGVSLTAFWARRARRILPAALLTLLTCAIAVIVLVPLTYWPQYFADLRASTGYVQNWHLAATAVDYFAAADAPSPVQHYWSLSVEEQFYLGWPVMMACAMLAVRRRSVRVKRVAVGVAMAVLTAWSLRYGLRATASDPGPAYFITSTRAWEFGAGGLLALLAPSGVGDAGRAALSWAGLAAIAVAGLAYTATTPFPGTAALLPVAGTLAVIRAGAPATRWAPTPGLALRPVQWLGDVSYSIYLWHWPLLVLAPFALHRPVTTPITIALLMLTLLLARLSKRFVEDPVRSAPFFVQRRFRWTAAAAVAATVAVLSVDLGGAAYVQAQIRKDERATHAILAAAPRCFGAAARDPRGSCANPALARTVVPSPVQAPQLRNEPCAGVRRDGVINVCFFGSPSTAPAATIALIGDSHASHWRAALDVVAKDKSWRGYSITHTSCPFSRATAEIPQPGRDQCVRWNRAIPVWLARHPEISTIYVAEHSGGRVVLPGGGDQFAAQVRGYQGAWRSLPSSVRHVVVIRDTPKMRGDTLACIERAMGRHQRPGRACAVPRDRALEPDPAASASARLASPRVGSVDLTPLLCDRRTCWPVIGGALVYKDVHHLTTVFAATLAPFLERDVDELMRGWGVAPST